MTHASPTPVPWEVAYEREYGDFGYATAPYVVGIDGPNGERVLRFDDDYEDLPANASLIVTAVNSHATLLSALESLLGAQITVSPSSDDTLECLCCGRSSDEDFNEFEFHDESMPCGRAAAAIKEARGEK